jgi:hypothetical protein
MKSLDSLVPHQLYHESSLVTCCFKPQVAVCAQIRKGTQRLFLDGLDCSHFPVGMSVVRNWPAFRVQWVQQ